MMTHFRQAAVIARRDFIATVATPAFLMFLLAPLFMLIFAVVGGTGARMIADSGEDARSWRRLPRSRGTRPYLRPHG